MDYEIILTSIFGINYTRAIVYELDVWVEAIVSITVKEIPAGDDEEGTSGQPSSKRLKVEPEKKKEKRHKVDEDEIQKMQ